MKRVVAMLMLVAAAGIGVAQTDPQQVTGFRVPSYDKDNVMTSQMFGDTAKLLPNGLVEITGLRMEFYSGDATNRVTEMRVTSPKCFYDRTTGSATSDAPVRIARDNMVVTGTGFVFDRATERLVILTDSKVVLRDVKTKLDEGVLQP